jgi:hypothetical protein
MMSLGLVLIIFALLLSFLDIVLWNAVAAYNRVLLTPLAVVFVCVALLVGAGAIQ